MTKIAKNLTVFLTVLFMVTGFAMGDVIVSQGFETDQTGYSHTPSQTPASDPGDQYFYRAEPSDASIYEGSVGPYTNVTGSWLFVGSNPNSINGGSPGVLTFDAIDVSGYSDLEFSADFGGVPSDWDATDQLSVEYSWNNSDWSTLYYFVSDDTNLPLNLAGNATGGNNTANGTTLTYALASIVSDNFTGTGSNLYIRIVCNSGANYEAFGVDNIVVSGTPAGGVADPTGFGATTASSSQINLSWVLNGNSDDVMVVYDEDGSFTDPTDGVSYSVSSSACGGTVIYNGSGTSYNHTSLSANTAYYYKAWSVDGSDNYSSGVTANATTYKVEPSNHAVSFAATSDYNTVSLTWGDNDGAQAADGFLIKSSTTSLVSIVDPVDGTQPSDDEDMSDGSGVVSVTHGVETFDWDGLDASTTHYYKIYPFTNSGTGIDYKTDGTIPTVTQATTEAPAAPTLIISEVADPTDDYTGRFVEVFNTGTSTIDFSSTTIYFARQSNGGSWASIQLTGTLAAETALVIGSATSVDALYGASTCDIDFSSVNGNGNDGYFLYVDGDQTSGSLFDAYGVVDVDGSGEDWEYTDSRAVRNSSVNTPNVTWTASEWTIVSANVADMNPGTHTIDYPLPITLTAFTATAKNGAVELAWETASETNNARFVIYRNDEAIASVEGAGTTTEPHSYTYTDDAVIPGVAYTYVLADVDYANEETKYEANAVTVTVDNGLVEADFVVGAAFPNPFNPATIVPIELSGNASVKASLYDLTGREVKALINANYTAGTHELRIDGSGLTTGIYLLHVAIDNVANIQKIALMK